MLDCCGSLCQCGVWPEEKRARSLVKVKCSRSEGEVMETWIQKTKLLLWHTRKVGWGQGHLFFSSLFFVKNCPQTILFLPHWTCSLTPNSHLNLRDLVRFLIWHLNVHVVWKKKDDFICLKVALKWMIWIYFAAKGAKYSNGHFSCLCARQFLLVTGRLFFLKVAFIAKKRFSFTQSVAAITPSVCSCICRPRVDSVQKKNDFSDTPLFFLAVCSPVMVLWEPAWLHQRSPANHCNCAVPKPPSPAWDWTMKYLKMPGLRERGRWQCNMKCERIEHL